MGKDKIGGAVAACLVFGLLELGSPGGPLVPTIRKVLCGPIPTQNCCNLSRTVAEGLDAVIAYFTGGVIVRRAIGQSSGEGEKKH
jgi:hypothetical protein